MKQDNQKPVSVFDEIKALRKEQDELLKKVTANALRDEFQGLFETYPAMTMIVVRCYTPSFNDGDPCRFTVSFDSDSDVFFTYNSYPEDLHKEFEDAVEQDPELKLDENGIDLAKSMVEARCHINLPFYRMERDYKDKLEDLKKLEAMQLCCKAVGKALNEIPDEVMETVFGDRVQIHITKNEVTTEEYDCGY